MKLFKRRAKREQEKMRGRIFRVEHTKTADDALKTTIFLKGCPLSCLWCQNPEGISPQREPMWLQEKCTGCGACVKTASAGGVRMEDGKILLSPQASEAWDAVLASCPSGALCWNSEDRTVEETMDLLLEDLPAHQREGGGLVLSGGDPLMQGPFAKELLMACKDRKIRTSMETELFGPWEAVDALAKDLDVLYVDLKLLESAQAKRYTGKGTMLIKDNLSKLLRGPHKEKVVVRTTLVPGITATEDNIASIARHIAEFDPQIPYELLNYDPETAAKYLPLRRKYFNPDLQPLSEEELQTFVRIAAMNGLERVRLQGREEQPEPTAD